MEDNITEMADKMGPEYFSRKLQDEVNIFMTDLDKNKKDLSKNDLVHMLKSIVAYPDIEGMQLHPKLIPIVETATNAKDTFVALTVQILMEEGKRKSEQDSQPKFKGE